MEIPSTTVMFNIATLESDFSTITIHHKDNKMWTSEAMPQTDKRICIHRFYNQIKS